MAKSEDPSIPNFMLEMLRVGHTDHPDSIVSYMACIVDLKNDKWKITVPWYGENRSV